MRINARHDGTMHVDNKESTLTTKKSRTQINSMSVLFEIFIGWLCYQALLVPPGMSSQNALMGCRRVLGDTHRPKLPITIDLLKAISSQPDLTQPMHVAFWAACLPASFPFGVSLVYLFRVLVDRRSSLDDRMFPYYRKTLL